MLKIVVLMMVATILIKAALAAELPWVELSSDGRLSMRIIVAADHSCPSATADGVALEMRPRTRVTDDDFPVIVCEAEVALGTTSAAIAGSPVPIIPKEVQRLVVIGDTGCRLKDGEPIQNCNDQSQWPFPTIAHLAAAKKPDLVIHVGDYYYREHCPGSPANCPAGPTGDKWPTWKADFFEPAAPLLAVAPWVLVRGNHERCIRGGKGWRHLLDPMPRLTECVDHDEPYRITLNGVNLLVFDSSIADEQADDLVNIYTRQLKELMTGSLPHSWLVTHQPFWALDHWGPITQTEQKAIRGNISANLDLVLSGHVHNFASYPYGPGRPAQIVVGDGGDLLDSQPDPKGAVIDGMVVQEAGFTTPLPKYGYFVLDRVEDGKSNGVLYGADDTVLARCAFRERDILCVRG